MNHGKMMKTNEYDEHYVNEHLDKYIEEPWVILGSYFKGQYLKQLVRHS